MIVAAPERCIAQGDVYRCGNSFSQIITDGLEGV